MDLKYTRRDLDPAARAFYERLAAGEFCVGRCSQCGHTAFPPSQFCRSCGAAGLELVAHSGRGTIYAFTTQERAFRFIAPDVIGLVELEGGGGRAFGVIKGTYEQLSIGMPVHLEPVETDDDWTLPAWSPD